MKRARIRVRGGRRAAGFWGALLACAAVSTSAAATEPRAAAGPAPVTAEEANSPSQAGNRPWAAGVSPDRQKAALDRMLEGNLLVNESLFVEAAKKYREALAQWDHPGIHYNLALALLNLDRPLEVHQQLESALKYGREPLDPDKFDSAQRYLKLVEKQLAPLEVNCKLDGATVRLDGDVLFQSPGSYQGLVRPGPHTVTATKEGYPTTEKTKVMLPGEPTTIQLRLYAAGELIEYRRPWALWKPIGLTVVGAVVLSSGVALTVAARDRFDAYDQAIRAQCLNGGCVPDPSMTRLKDRGNTLQRWSILSYTSGGLLLAAGVAFLVLDRAVPFRTDPEADKGVVASRAPAVSPVVGPGGLAGLSMTGRF